MRADAHLCLREGSPLFVTWNKADARGGMSLRGCIGNLSPMDIHIGASMAVYMAVSLVQNGKCMVHDHALMVHAVPLKFRKAVARHCGIRCP